MIRTFVADAASNARLAAAVLLAAVGLRYAIDAINRAIAAEEPRLEETARPQKPRLPRPAPPRPSASNNKPKEFLRGEAARVTLSVTAGVDRSEVFVNGVFRGNTPYVGDLSCKVGEPLKIDIVPPKGRGAPEQLEKVCIPGNIRISDW